MFCESEGNSMDDEKREPLMNPRSHRPQACLETHAREPGDPAGVRQ